MLGSGKRSRRWWNPSGPSISRCRAGWVGQGARSEASGSEESYAGEEEARNRGGWKVLVESGDAAGGIQQFHHLVAAQLVGSEGIVSRGMGSARE